MRTGVREIPADSQEEPAVRIISLLTSISRLEVGSGGGQGAMRVFLTVVVIVAVVVLGALEIIASRSLPDTDRPPNASASTPYYWR